MVTAAAFEVDATHRNNKEYRTTAADHAGDFILWAWQVGAGRVTATRLTSDPNNASLKHFKNECHQSCIIKPCMNIPGGLTPASVGENANAAVLVGLLNATLARQVDKQEIQNNILTKQLNHMIEKNGSTKNRVKHLHESTIKMLLFALAMDNETVPIDLSESCKCIINSKLVALAKQELNLQFENHGMTKVSFPMGYIANMYRGSLLWSSSNIPSNHSPFSFLEAEPLRMEEHKNCHLMFQLILTQGKEMTVDEIKCQTYKKSMLP
jgi:hypothetical protein